ncbi:MAG TPA: IS256 family transposase [Candidatus Limnocylindrales bacterium]|nr:IS256 family transposase [Candidatus Limnocylindrales bacterium]
MADDSMALLETLRKMSGDGDVDVLREGVRLLAQAILEAEVTELTGVAKGERNPEARLTHRNGYRERRWDTRVGTIPLEVPRVRDGSYMPSLLDPRRRAERALLAVIQEAYVSGVSTRRVDDLVRALGIEGISKSEVSRICAALDAEVAAFRTRPLTDAAYPDLWLDATYLKVREGGRVVSMAALVAVGVATTGERRVLGLELAAGNDEGSAWPAFIRGLVERGLHGVRLIVSDDHAGLVKAVHEQLLGSGWQRCRVHFTRNAQDLVPRSARSMVASAIRSVFEQPDGASAREQLDCLIDGLARPYPRVADLLAAAEVDLLAHFAFPEAHRSRIRSTNPLERLNKEIKRRTAVVGIFPNRAAVIRLVGMILAEQDDEWQDGRRYFRPETMTAIDAVPIEEVGQPLLLAS